MRLILSALFTMLVVTLSARADDKFPTLKVGTNVYNNVTVLNATPTDIFFTHKGGMGNAKLKDLEPELQKHFNYDAAKAVDAQNKSTAAGNETGTSGKQGSQTAGSPATAVYSPDITLIETVEKKDKREIEERAAALLIAKDFNKLEELADVYRTSKACYASGSWKLSCFYSGMTPSDSKSHGDWQTSLSNLRDWVRVKPDSITARVALADALVDYAWKARGDGYADTVSETGWKLFRERLTEAVETLKEAEALKEKCPYAWSVALTAARGLGIERSEYEQVFQKAITSEPGFVKYYCEKADYLLPRWHGKPGDTGDFVQKAADQIGGEEGDFFYARVAWHLQKLTGAAFREAGLSWERTDRGFQIIETRFPDSLYVQNERAYLAAVGCGKTRAPRRLIANLHGKIDPDAWTSEENFIRLTRSLYPPINPLPLD